MLLELHMEQIQQYLKILALPKIDTFHNEACAEAQHGHAHAQAGYNEGGKPWEKTCDKIFSKNRNKEYEGKQGQKAGSDPENLERPVVAVHPEYGFEHLEAVTIGAELGCASFWAIAIRNGTGAYSEPVFKGKDGQFGLKLEARAHDRIGLGKEW